MSSRISLTTFTRESSCHRTGTDLDDLLAEVSLDSYSWIHVSRADAATSARILEHFGLPLTLAEQLGAAALEFDTSSDRYLLKKFRFLEEAPAAEGRPPERDREWFLIKPAETDRFVEGSGTVILGANFLLLFEDQTSTIVAKAIDAISRKEKEVRERGIDYLLYRLAKNVFIDNYFMLLRRLTDRAQELEASLLEGSTDTMTYREVTRLRRELNPFARSLTYIAEFTATVRGEKPEVLNQAGLDDLAENLRADGDRLETELSILRDTTAQLIQTYRDNVNTQLNNVMRTLTAISAMFLPLSFITSFYGMNFSNMPALKWEGSFYIVITLMLSIVIGSFVFARRHKWM